MNTIRFKHGGLLHQYLNAFRGNIDTPSCFDSCSMIRRMLVQLFYVGWLMMMFGFVFYLFIVMPSLGVILMVFHGVAFVDLPDGVGVSLICLVSLATILVFGFVLNWLVAAHHRRREYREPSRTAKLYRSWRDKFCVPVEFTED